MWWQTNCSSKWHRKERTSIPDTQTKSEEDCDPEIIEKLGRTQHTHPHTHTARTHRTSALTPVGRKHMRAWLLPNCDVHGICGNFAMFSNFNESFERHSIFAWSSVGPLPQFVHARPSLAVLVGERWTSVERKCETIRISILWCCKVKSTVSQNETVRLEELATQLRDYITICFDRRCCRHHNSLCRGSFFLNSCCFALFGKSERHAPGLLRKTSLTNLMFSGPHSTKLVMLLDLQHKLKPNRLWPRLSTTPLDNDHRIPEQSWSNSLLHGSVNSPKRKFSKVVVQSNAHSSKKLLFWTITGFLHAS